MSLHESLILLRSVTTLSILQFLIYGLGVAIVSCSGFFAISSGYRRFALKTWTIVQPFGFAAMAVGWMAGNSRAPVLGTVLPAMLTFVGGFFALVFGREPSERAFVLTSVPLISMMLFLGTSMGAMERYHFNDELEQIRDNGLKVRLRTAAETEAAYLIYRENLQLGNTTGVSTEILKRFLREDVEAAPK